MKEDKEETDERPFDELLSEILWRTHQLKKKAKAIQDDQSVAKRIIRWMNK